MRPEPLTAPLGAADQANYSCPMHPQVRQGSPGSCPHCGMRLVASGAANAGRGLVHTGMPDCPHCLVNPSRPGSAKVAWGIAIAALIALVVVVFFRIGPTGNLLVGGGSLFLLAVLLCPLTMGAMMFFMMRKGH